MSFAITIEFVGPIVLFSFLLIFWAALVRRVRKDAINVVARWNQQFRQAHRRESIKGYMDELRNRIESMPSLLLFHRSSSVAPIMGVCWTAFIFVSTPTESSNSDVGFAQFRPAFWGMMLFGLAAIIHAMGFSRAVDQILDTLLGIRKVPMMGFREKDPKVLEEEIKRAKDALNDLANQTATLIGDLAERFREVETYSERMSKAAATIQASFETAKNEVHEAFGAGAKWRGSLELISHNLVDLSKEIVNMTRSTESSAKSIKELGGKIESNELGVKVKQIADATVEVAGGIANARDLVEQVFPKSGSSGVPLLVKTLEKSGGALTDAQLSLGKKLESLIDDSKNLRNAIKEESAEVQKATKAITSEVEKIGDHSRAITVVDTLANASEWVKELHEAIRGINAHTQVKARDSASSDELRDRMDGLKNEMTRLVDLLSSDKAISRPDSG